jgi:hypothetical protein
MALLPSQFAVLKASIAADPLLAPLSNDLQGDRQKIADAYNAQAVPDFWVFRTRITNEEIGDAMNGTEITGLSSLQMQRLQVLAAYSGGTQSAARADRRAAFDQVFSGAGGATTRASLAVTWRRLATRAEKLFATIGTGAIGDPATMAFEGNLTQTEVQQARNS